MVASCFPTIWKLKVHNNSGLYCTINISITREYKSFTKESRNQELQFYSTAEIPTGTFVSPSPNMLGFSYLAILLNSACLTQSFRLVPCIPAQSFHY